MDFENAVDAVLGLVIVLSECFYSVLSARNSSFSCNLMSNDVLGKSRKRTLGERVEIAILDDIDGCPGFREGSQTLSVSSFPIPCRTSRHLRQ